MSITEEKLSDENLASRISDDGRLSAMVDPSDEDGILEVGSLSHGVVSDAEIDTNLIEEPFSIDDFDDQEGVSTSDSASTSDEPVEAGDSFENEMENIDESGGGTPNSIEEDHDSDMSENTGEVTEFRKTLSALSRQLEIDRLTLLYKEMQTKGKPLPNLGKIAADIRGDSQLQPVGDEDAYSKRPFARLQGWIAGLSFGVGRRAKKFSRSDG